MVIDFMECPRMMFKYSCQTTWDKKREVFLINGRQLESKWVPKEFYTGGLKKQSPNPNAAMKHKNF